MANLNRAPQAYFDRRRNLFLGPDKRIPSEGGQVCRNMPCQPHEIMRCQHWDEIEPKLLVIWKNAVKTIDPIGNSLSER
jgi:hypothetical protein